MTIDVDPRNAVPDELFNGFHIHPVRRGCQRKGLSRPAGASCAADTVNIVLGLHGDVIVEDSGQVVDIEAAGGHITGDEEVDFCRS